MPQVHGRTGAVNIYALYTTPVGYKEKLKKMFSGQEETN